MQSVLDNFPATAPKLQTCKNGCFPPKSQQKAKSTLNPILNHYIVLQQYTPTAPQKYQIVVHQLSSED